ncbi:MliC family protein [Martelella sp. HB161492]|uniref:MliC family protein n=1 Tax=Martelella sp. HB161492 TaxID=2720726 RepID=UPI001FEEEA00|nr:MliC family protein [Martelella sp. HB161492]
MKALIALAGANFALALLAVTPALAEDAITIPLPAGVTAATIDADYDCGGTSVKAQYINAGDVHLATLAFDDQFTVASEAIAASGARYVSGFYVWWTKGDDATLYDMRKGENDPGIACKAAG